MKKAKLINGKNRKEMREYSIWKVMRTRCNNPNTDSAEYYHNKGITVCERWDSFENFYKDMGPCPEGYSIDRIDSSKGYCKENCRWANNFTQAQNRPDFNEYYTYKGKTHTLKEWARILNIKYTTLYMRIHRSNLFFEDAIKSDPFKKEYEYKGESHRLKEWCNILGLEYSLISNRVLKHKWDFKDAVEIPKGGRRKKNKNSKI